MAQAGIVSLTCLCLTIAGSPSSFTPHIVKLHGLPGDGYYVTMMIGTPPQILDLLIDTGSSNLAIAAYKDEDVEKFFNAHRSTTFHDIGTAISVRYTQGQWSGTLGADFASFVNLFNNSSASSVVMNIALITAAENFFVNNSGWQGILGLAYESISLPDGKVKPSFDSFYESGLVNNSFSLQLCGTEDTPLSDNVATGGQMTFGAIDSSQYTGQLYSAAIVEENYYKIIVTDMKVDNISLGLDCQEFNNDKAIVDSGTTNLKLPDNVFKKTISSIKEKAIHTSLVDAFWTGDSLACVPHNDSFVPFLMFPFVSIDIMSADYADVFTLEVSPEQYLRAVPPTSGKPEDCYKFSITSSIHGTVLGAILMEGFFVNFDRANKQINFAKTTCKPRSLKSQSSFVSHYRNYLGNPFDCKYTPKYQLPPYAIALITLASCLVFLLLFVLGFKAVKRFRRQKQQILTDIDIANLVHEGFDTEY